MNGFLSFRDAVSFLTILPGACPLVDPQPEVRMGRAMAWFPLVGALVGGAGGGVVFLTAGLFPASASASVSAILGLAAMVILTGGLHLDGFSDTVDGFGATAGGKEKALEVMHDSRIGAFGAIGLFLLLGLKWSLIQAVPSHRWIGSLAAACALSRWGMVLSAQSFPYVRGKQGLGRLVTDRRSPESVTMATAMTLGIVLAAAGLGKGLLLVALGAAAVWLFNSLCMKRLGGITGDTLGAVNEVVEALALLCLVI
ncbi:MAG: adenosylcobinamide-GDP ribazoletransferase [Candidatus Omnitrophica bacterium]|nr:adenosylcobinamide-GDP ribazoletransferase [Candidatus Omnitrophota bacterium]